MYSTKILRIGYVISFMFFGILLNSLCFAQNTITIPCIGTSGSYNSGYVTSGGSKMDGNLQVIGNGRLRRGWASFDLSAIPAGSSINSVTLEFTVTSNNTPSTINNEIHGFTGSPASMSASTLYNNCRSGTNFNNSTWAQNSTNTLPFNNAGVTFVSDNIGEKINIGFVRGNATSIYEIAGYPSGSNQPKLIINYTPPCTPPSITSHPSASTVCASANTGFSVTASGTSLTYQWQVNTTGTWNNIGNGGIYNGATTSALSITGATAAMNGYQYRCVVSSGVCQTNSNPATLTVNTVPTQSVITGPSTTCEGSSVTYSVPAVSGVNYLWNTPSGWDLTSGGNTNTVRGCPKSPLINKLSPIGKKRFK